VPDLGRDGCDALLWGILVEGSDTVSFIPVVDNFSGYRKPSVFSWSGCLVLLLVESG